MNIVLLSFFVFGFLVGIALTMIVVVSVMEHYERMEEDE